MTKSIIAVDLDDVLGDENHAMMQFVNSRYGTKHTLDDYNITAEYWGYWETVWGVDTDEGAVRYAAFLEANLANEIMFEPIPGAVEALSKLKETYGLVIVTSRKAALLHPTKRWLEEHFPATFTGVYFVELWGGKDKVTKARICQEVGADYLIDDNVEHCNLAQATGVQALLFGDYGWNRGVKLSDAVVRVADWQAVREYFDGKRS